MTNVFQTWLPLDRLSLADLPRFGDFAAVYAFRDSTTKGVLKYGSTGRLRRRIFGEYFGGTGGGTTQRIHAELFTNGWASHVEIAWHETKDREEATRMEKDLRATYEKVNGKLPQWDRQR